MQNFPPEHGDAEQTSTHALLRHVSFAAQVSERVHSYVCLGEEVPLPELVCPDGAEAGFCIRPSLTARAIMKELESLKRCKGGGHVFYCKAGIRHKSENCKQTNKFFHVFLLCGRFNLHEQNNM